MGLGAGSIQVDRDERLAVRDPARGTVIEELPVADGGAVAAAVHRARAAQAAWGARSVRERAKLLRRARRELVRDRAAILDRLERETGKARVDVVGELMGVCIESGHMMRRAARWLRPLKVATRPLFGKRGRVVFKPRGVVGIISPWNAPLNLALGDAIPALLAGNAVVIKPSELAPLAVSRAVVAMNRVLPPDLLQVVIGAGPTGAALVDHVDMVCVTGSPETGRRVMERASRRLTPVLLELGGKDPMIVLADADLDRAARAAAWGGCMMSGQVCMSVERVYVEEAVAETFTKKLVAQMQALRVGPNGPDADIDYGAFTSPRQMAIVEEHLADAVAKGARVLTGGKARPDLGPYFYEPTILEGVTPDMTCFGNETFGPVISLYRFHDEADAIARANDGEYGLNAAVYSKDGDRARGIARQIKCGTVNINEAFGATFASIESPMGGMRQSGMGRRQGSEGIHRYTETQSVAVQRVVRLSPMLGMSDETYAKVMTASVRLMTKLGRK